MFKIRIVRFLWPLLYVHVVVSISEYSIVHLAPALIHAYNHTYIHAYIHTYNTYSRFKNRQCVAECSRGSLLSAPVVLANSQYFMENLMQCVWEKLQQDGVDLSSTYGSVLVGGDGRLFNQFAAEMIIRIFAANGAQRVRIPRQLTLTSAQAELELLNTQR